MLRTTGGEQVYETTYYLRTLMPACSFCRSRSVCHTAPHQRAARSCREGRQAWKAHLVKHKHERGIREQLVRAYRGEQLQRVVYPVRPRVLLEVLRRVASTFARRRNGYSDDQAQRGSRLTAANVAVRVGAGGRA